jgi:hypothetical protein
MISLIPARFGSFSRDALSSTKKAQMQEAAQSPGAREVFRRNPHSFMASSGFAA